MITKPLIKESLLLLNIVGQHPINQNMWSKIRAVVSLTLIFGLDIEILLEVIFHWSGMNSVQSIAFFIGVYQMGFRGFILIVNRRKFAKVLIMIENFWTPHQSCENAEKSTTDIQVTYKIAKKVMGYVFLIYEAIVLLVFGVFLMRGELPLKMYHPTYFNKSPDFELGMVLSFLSSLTTVVVLLGFDFLYAGIIIHVIYELKIIKQKFKTAPINLSVNHDDDNCLKELYLLVDRHNFVLRCIKSMNGIYSLMLLNQFLTSILSFATILTAIATSRTATDVNFMPIIFLSAFISQLYFYCLGGSFLTTECESVTEAAYESEWWAKTQPKFRNSLVLIIQRAQKVEMLSAGGIFPANLQTFTSIINTAGSFFSVMLAAYRDKN